MPLHVLEAANREQRTRWLSVLRRWPDREVFADPAYVELFLAEGERAVALYFDGNHGTVLFPLILRPLGTLSWCNGVGFWDATSAYGYGGPYFLEFDDRISEEFGAQHDGWAETQSLVTTFSRLSLFTDQRNLPIAEVFRAAPNVVRGLDLDEEELWRDYAHKVRKNVKRAQREGVKVRVDEKGKSLDEFLEIYRATMERRHASKRYMFPRSFFERLVAGLKGQFALFYADLGETPISTELVLVSNKTMYSFLGGTRSDFFSVRPNDYLKHEIICWGRERGKRAFVLGGGYSGEDGIFRYKQSFAPQGVKTFSVLKQVHNQRSYRQLIEERRAWETKSGNVWEPSEGFFPAYRG
jgi:hypothetical protein